MEFTTLFPASKPLIGMIHLPALPSYPSHISMEYVIEKAIADLLTLQKAGFDGALVENDNDQPHMISITPGIQKAFVHVMRELKKIRQIPLGMEIIYDMKKTVQVGSTVADFVRLDVFVDTVESAYGIIPAESQKLISLRKKLQNPDLLFLTDIQVKHTQLLKERPIRDSAQEAKEAGSDALIVTGSWTGIQPTQKDCKEIKQRLPDFPLLIGSGFSSDNAKDLLTYTDGAIVGTSIKTGDYISLEKAKEIKNLVIKLRSS